MKSELLENSDTCRKENSPLGKKGTADVFIRDYIECIWRRKAAFFLWTLIITVVVTTGGAFIYFSQEKREIAVLQFKLEFDGVENGEYPNGLKFSPMDIISDPVLDMVFSQNDLKKYMKLAQFKKTVSIVQMNEKLGSFKQQYAEILNNKKLEARQRERIETDYLEKKKGIMVPVYSLILSREGLLKIPHEQVPKVLRNILQTWAEYATRVKGVTKYKIPLFSCKVVDEESLRSEDYLVAIDILRKTITRINESIGQMATIPGAESVVVGKEKIKLNDVRILMKDLERFQLGYLTSLVREKGITRNPIASRLYIKNQLFELDLEKKKALSKKRIYEDSMKEYGAPSPDERVGGSLGAPSLSSGGQSSAGNIGRLPAFGSSFLDSLIQLGQERSDTDFRQKITKNAIGEGIKEVNLETKSSFYADILDKLEQKNAQAHSNGMGKRGDEIFMSVCKSVKNAIEQLNAIYLKISEENLTTSAGLFTISGPVVVRNLKSVSTVRLLGLIFLVWCAAESVLLFAILNGNSSVRRQTPGA
jgi:hypothetical protein